jgi:hypothetical protein
VVCKGGFVGGTAVCLFVAITAGGTDEATVLDDPFHWAILDLELCEVNETEVELSLAATGEFEREVMHALPGPTRRKKITVTAH